MTQIKVINAKNAMDLEELANEFLHKLNKEYASVVNIKYQVCGDKSDRVYSVLIDYEP